MIEHRTAGRDDMRRTHENLEWLEPSRLDGDVTVCDLSQGIEAAPQNSTERDPRGERGARARREDARPSGRCATAGAAREDAGPDREAGTSVALKRRTDPIPFRPQEEQPCD